MKTIKYITATILLSSLAFNAYAGSSNGPKLRCQNGQIPVLENNEWKCGNPHVQAPTSNSESQSSSRFKLKKASPLKPPRAKPDLSIANIIKLNDPTPQVDSFKAYVKNTKNIASSPSKLSFVSNGAGGEVNVASIPANSGKWIEVQFFEFKDGARISLMVDSQKKVNETNESNNKYTFNW